MVEAWAAVTSWATPTALFILLNIVIGFIAIFASRKHDEPQPPPPDHHQYEYQIHQHHEDSPRRLVRAPSLFSRVTSFEFSNLNYSVSGHHDHDSAAVNDIPPPPIARAPSLLSRMTSFTSFYHHESVESEIHTTTTMTTEPPPSLLARMTSFNRFSLTKSVDSEIDPPEKSSDPAISRAPSLLSRMASFNFSLHRSTEPEPEPEPEPEQAKSVEAREEHVTRSETEPVKKRKKPPAGNKMKKSSTEKSTETTSLEQTEECVNAKADDFINRFKQQLRLQRIDSLLRYRSSA